MIGSTISHYGIIGKLGEGGMGVVYKAEDTRLGRTVALKFLPAGLTYDDEARARFVHEARGASALDHPNIATVYEIGEAEELSFISMAYIQGKTLTALLAERALTLDEVLDLAIQIAEGLCEAHGKDIVHRDIKPENIMVTPRGVPKVMDFGLAKLSGASRLTEAGTTIGTISYMSPEQIQGAKPIVQATYSPSVSSCAR